MKSSAPYFSLKRSKFLDFSTGICLLLFLGSWNGVFSQSASRIDSLKTSFEKETNDSLKVVYEMTLAKEIHRDSHQNDREYGHAQGAIDRALKFGDTLLYARALDNMGLLYRYHQHYDEALKLHSKAFELVREKDVEPIYKMIFANNAGVAGRYHQKYDTAFEYYMKALKIAEQENDLRNIAIASNGIGNTLSSIPGREKEIMPFFKRALEAEEKRNNTLGMAMNYLSISGHYIDIGDYGTARDYLNKLLQVNIERNDLFGLAITYEYFGLSYLKEGINLEKAVSYFHQSIDQFKSLNNQHKKAALLIHLGDTYLKRNKLEEAEENYQQALKIAKKLNALSLVSSSAYKISEVSEKRGDYKAALPYYKLSQVYKDSIKLNEQNVKIEALTQEYDLEKKENHIQLLEKDKALQQAVLETQKEQIERKQIVNVLLAIGLVSILVIFLLQYRNYRTKKMANERLTRSEKEKMNSIYERNLAQAEILVTRLRVNPHFLFNSLNAINYLVQSEQNTKAIQYLEIFSHYTRMVLETSKQQLIPLLQELELADHYLALEENRFAQDFKFYIHGNDNPELEAVKIPPLLLQPFLENAIWHGLLVSQKKEKTLNIHIRQADDTTQIIIDDNGAGRKTLEDQKKVKRHKSMGMQITSERMDLYNKTYSGNISYSIVDKKDEEGNALGTQVILELENTANPFPFYNQNATMAPAM